MIANKQQLADIHGVSERTLTDWANAGMPAIALGGVGRGYSNQYDTAATIEWRLQRAISGYQVESAKERRDRLEGDRIELMLAKEAGLLVAVEEVEPLWTTAILSAKSDMMEGIYRLKSELDAAYGVDIDVALLEDHVNQTLSKLSDRPPLPTESPSDEFEADLIDTEEDGAE